MSSSRKAIATASRRFRGSRIDLIGVVAQRVVNFAFLLIAQYVVGFRDLLELLFCPLIPGIHVGVVLPGELAEGLANVVRGRGLLDSQNRVIIFGWCRCHVLVGSVQSGFKNSAGSR